MMAPSNCGGGAPMLRRLHLFFDDRVGATAIEYALIASLISITIIGGVTAIGSTISTQFFGPIAGSL
jgi:pilus assembly protein Flp/PilA